MRSVADSESLLFSGVPSSVLYPAGRPVRTEPRPGACLPETPIIQVHRIENPSPSLSGAYTGRVSGGQGEGYIYKKTVARPGWASLSSWGLPGGARGAGAGPRIPPGQQPGSREEIPPVKIASTSCAVRV